MACSVQGYESQWKLGYDNLLKSGMFWEFYPTFTGVWECDKSRYMRYINNLVNNSVVENT